MKKNAAIPKLKPVSHEAALNAVKTLLHYIGENPNREGLEETPDRVLKSLTDMCSGYALRPEEILNKTFAVSNTEMIVLNNIEFVSMCEHHLLPFRGVCHIGYLPKTRVLGLSKLARLTELYARRLQIQEEMTYQIGSALMKHLNPLGVGVLITAEHMCMSCRGINKQNAVMVTSSMLGEFQKNDVKKDFIARCALASRIQSPVF